MVQVHGTYAQLVIGSGAKYGQSRVRFMQDQVSGNARIISGIGLDSIWMVIYVCQVSARECKQISVQGLFQVSKEFHSFRKQVQVASVFKVLEG